LEAFSAVISSSIAVANAAIWSASSMPMESPFPASALSADYQYTDRFSPVY
jgi:hypothetical protein